MDLNEPRPSQPSRKRTILIADDDSAMLNLLADHLRRKQFLVVTANDGAKALDAARSHEAAIDLLLTDIEMPRLNGVQLAQAIREFLPRIGVVLMSGTAYKGGAGDQTAFLKKPFSLAILLDTIEKLLG
jgi:DNA-binding NtrC family response regulator